MTKAEDVIYDWNVKGHTVSPPMRQVRYLSLIHI